MAIKYHNVLANLFFHHNTLIFQIWNKSFFTTRIIFVTGYASVDYYKKPSFSIFFFYHLKNLISILLLILLILLDEQRIYNNVSVIIKNLLCLKYPSFWVLLLDIHTLED